MIKQITPKLIKTAPVDGAMILAYDPTQQIWMAVRWSGWGGGIWQCASSGHNIMSTSFSHWIPMLPSPSEW